MNWPRRLIKTLASLKLAVVVILGLATVAAVGTIYEARYDAEYAQKLVYQSPYMYAVLGLLCINLIAVMVDRWPWRPHHLGFVLAHVGIITTLFGAWLTQRYGIDGTLSFEIGQENRQIVINQRDLIVYSSLDGTNLRPIFEREVDFLLRPPNKKPLVANIGSERLEVVDYYHWALRKSEILPSTNKSDGPAVRFQLQNDRVNLTEWIRRESRRPYQVVNLGPARVILSDGSYQPGGNNEIVLEPGRDPQYLRYKIISQKQQRKVLTGEVAEGAVIATGWMGLQLRILRLLPQAYERISFEPLSTPKAMAQSAIKVRFRDQEHWLGLNSVMRLFSSDNVTMISYGNRRLDVGFPLRLLQFQVGRYEGTMRAASYASEVEVPNIGPVTISMNEPLKHNGFTFYQSSFEQNEKGEPVASILSVNFDPGREIKYLGSLLIVLGSLVLFYFKKLRFSLRLKMPTGGRS